jgi:hypothetical protein
VTYWRELSTRLVADAQVVAQALEARAPKPTPGEAGEFLQGVHHMIEQLTRVSIGIGRTYGPDLPESVLGDFRVAVQHMQAVSLATVADALGGAGKASPGGAQR